MSISPFPIPHATLFSTHFRPQFYCIVYTSVDWYDIILFIIITLKINYTCVSIFVSWITRSTCSCEKTLTKIPTNTLTAKQAKRMYGTVCEKVCSWIPEHRHAHVKLKTVSNNFDLIDNHILHKIIIQIIIIIFDRTSSRQHSHNCQDTIIFQVLLQSIHSCHASK